METGTGFSLDGYDDYEKQRVINTPLSLEACRMEGVLPEELLYKPREAFIKADFSKEVQQMHYDFHETKRMESLQLVRQSRQVLVHRHAHSTSQISSHTLARSEEFERSLQVTKARQIALATRVALKETSQAKKLSKLRNDEDEKDKVEDERRKLEEKRIKKEAENKRKADLERLKKSKEEEERREKLRLMQEEKEVEIEKRFRDREEKLLKIREQQAKKREILKAEIQKRLMEKQTEQEEVKTIKEQKATCKESERENKLEEQKALFRKKISEKAQQRKLRQAQAKHHAEHHFKKVKITQKAADILLSEERTEQRTAMYRKQLEEKIEELRRASSEKEIRLKQVHEAAIAKYAANREKMLEAFNRSQQRAETQRRRLIEQFEVKKQMSELKRMKKDFYIERQRRRDEYQTQQSNRRMAEIQARIEAFETAKEKMMEERRKLNLENEQLKMSIRGAMNRMTLTKKWDEEEIKKLIESGKGDGATLELPRMNSKQG